MKLWVAALGCIDAVEPHLHTLIPYLINTLNDSKVWEDGSLEGLYY